MERCRTQELKRLVESEDRIFRTIVLQSISHTSPKVHNEVEKNIHKSHMSMSRIFFVGKFFYKILDQKQTFHLGRQVMTLIK